MRMYEYVISILSILFILSVVLSSYPSIYLPFYLLLARWFQFAPKPDRAREFRADMVHGPDATNEDAACMFVFKKHTVLDALTDPQQCVSLKMTVGHHHV